MTTPIEEPGNHRDQHNLAPGEATPHTRLEDLPRRSPPPSPPPPASPGRERGTFAIILGTSSSRNDRMMQDRCRNGSRIAPSARTSESAEFYTRPLILLSRDAQMFRMKREQGRLPRGKTSLLRLGTLVLQFRTRTNRLPERDLLPRDADPLASVTRPAPAAQGPPPRSSLPHKSRQSAGFLAASARRNRDLACNQTTRGANCRHRTGHCRICKIPTFA